MVEEWRRLLLLLEGSEAEILASALCRLGESLMLGRLPSGRGFLMLDQPPQSSNNACVLGIGICSCDSVCNGGRARFAVPFLG
jgi:hypothetical protein